jgi:hypothetical protein
LIEGQDQEVETALGLLGRRRRRVRLPNNIANTAPWGENAALSIALYPVRVWERWRVRRYWR